MTLNLRPLVFLLCLRNSGDPLMSIPSHRTAAKVIISPKVAEDPATILFVVQQKNACVIFIRKENGREVPKQIG